MVVLVRGSVVVKYGWVVGGDLVVVKYAWVVGGDLVVVDVGVASEKEAQVCETDTREVLYEGREKFLGCNLF